MDDTALVVLFVSYTLLVFATKLMNKRPNYSNQNKIETPGKEIIYMKKIKKIMFTVFLAALLGAAPMLSLADEPQATTTEQQTIVAPADQQAPPVAPAPQEGGSTTETGK
jgi:hypothetical protein